MTTKQATAPSPKACIESFREMEPDPLDYSFCRLTSISDALEEEPRVLPPVSPRIKKPKETEDGKSAGKSFKLNNNFLTDLKCFPETVEKLFQHPEDLYWLDLSFNNIDKIDEILLEYKNIGILYLHGNEIQDLKQIEKLAALPNLKKLTLHGNPIAEKKGYRHYILGNIPQLKTLDFSAVTKSDKATAETWSKRPMKGKKKKHPKD